MQNKPCAQINDTRKQKRSSCLSESLSRETCTLGHCISFSIFSPLFLHRVPYAVRTLPTLLLQNIHLLYGASTSSVLAASCRLFPNEEAKYYSMASSKAFPFPDVYTLFFIFFAQNSISSASFPFFGQKSNHLFVFFFFFKSGVKSRVKKHLLA